MRNLARNGAPGRIRTCGLWLRRQTLYPAELRARPGENNRAATRAVAPATRSEPDQASITCPAGLGSRSRCDCASRRHGYRAGSTNPLRGLVRPAGLEPAATWFEAKCSIQLSYRRTNGHHIISPARDGRPPPWLQARAWPQARRPQAAEGSPLSHDAAPATNRRLPPAAPRRSES
jgi:hypothetical protein